MTIRRLLLIAFLLVSLVPATALTLQAFNSSRAALLSEIEQGLRRSAQAVSANLDRMLFERLLNATTWNHLEVMQDLRIGDVDKRLSDFLAEMKRRYGDVYLDLLAVDAGGRVVAASEAARIGGRLPRAAVWLRTPLAGGVATLELPKQHRLVVRSGIVSEFAEGEIGELVLEVDRAQMERTLDASATPDRQVLVLDAQGRVVAASGLLRERGVEPLASLPDWLPRSSDTPEERPASPWIAEPLLLQGQRSDGFADFAGTGWTTVLLQSRAAALAPVRRMAASFAGLLASTAVVTALVSLWVASLLAGPIAALTAFVRRYGQPGMELPPPPPGPGEIGELSRSFVRLIGQLERSQDTLMQASKLAALGEVTALMAHEVRTPLGILRSSAQMLRGEPRLSAEGDELVGIIQTETERLNRLVASMLDSARMRPPQLAPQDVHALMNRCAVLLAAQARERGVTLHLHAAARRSIVHCDAEQITQVLLNLVTNALQVLPRGGRVDIRTHDEVSRLVIEVADDGPGIPAAERTRVFEPFVFKREGGVGLGLAVVRQILRQHGGDVAVEASESGGALLRFWLPRNEEEVLTATVEPVR